ncbi:hypothetical protein M595_3251 [Lyngbya aestuarii BL J]|uniref:Uncharacterized protein n=1 Tax=Lyngbya aestuarii BL J TaxID=1348334 RepID=U7QFV2_9CYAN|nr:hypothetical protein M595_3251 [Lyngbya aestuarii BL J]
MNFSEVCDRKLFFCTQDRILLASLSETYFFTKPTLVQCFT